MTKQEEIREGLQAIIDGYDSTLPIDDPCPHCKVVDGILTYLHARGVVLKVERELPPTYFANRKKMPWITDHDVEICAQQDMIKAGFTAVEPLIEAEVGTK